jgi:hypothetical protein
VVFEQETIMADIEVAYDPISVNSGPVSVTVAGLNDIKLAVTEPIETKSALTLSVPDPIKTDSTAKLETDSKFALALPDPIRTESKAALDLQPVVLDQCLRLTLGPLPLTRICLPNRQRIGFTLFGTEIFGVTLDGEAQFLIGEPPKHPQVVATPVGPPPRVHVAHMHVGAGPDDVGRGPHHESARDPVQGPGVIVRLGEQTG